MIISVGYRVKSHRGIEFRQWANKVLKEYIVDGYAINENRLNALEKTVDIQTRMLAGALNVEEKDVLRAVAIRNLRDLENSVAIWYCNSTLGWS